MTLQADGILQRIGHDGSTVPTLEILGELQQSFLRSVPFENLDSRRRLEPWQPALPRLSHILRLPPCAGPEAVKTVEGESSAKP